MSTKWRRKVSSIKLDFLKKKKRDTGIQPDTDTQMPFIEIGGPRSPPAGLACGYLGQKSDVMLVSMISYQSHLMCAHLNYNCL